MRGRRALLLAAALAALAGAGAAEAPGAVPRPEARAATPAGHAGAEAPLPPPVPETPPPDVPAPARPRLRPPDAPADTPTDTPGARPEASSLAVARAVLPRDRPAGIVAKADRARAALARGQVCGTPGLQGEVVAPVGGPGGCGIAEPVRLRSVDGVPLSAAALMDCGTARALLTWVRDGARPALRGRGGGLARLDVMGDYACRPRNNQAGQRLSEHGRGRAIDIGAVTLADGSTLSVLGDWPDPALRRMHEAACGSFSTVLGPEANAFHRNHFHFDTAPGRGWYCR